MKKRFLALFLVFVLSISLLAGCSSTPAAEPSKNDTPATEQTPSTSTEQTEQAAPAEDVVYKDELHVGYNLEPATLDPMMVADAPVRVVTYGNIYEALVTLDAEFNVKPELCESYEVNNDGREYLYHLRTGIKFHNGEEMTADDVVASMNRWIEHYGNAQNTVGESRFEKVDDSTVKIVFDGPIAFFNELIATQSQGSVIMPKSVIENVDASTGEVQEYIGTGPYKFVEWKSGTYIKLEKFEDYSPYGVEGEASGWYGYKTQATPVIYYDIVRQTEQEEKFGYRFVDFDTLLRESDIYTIHCPLNEETRGMIGAEQFAQMKPTAMLINTARGPIVDEAALIDALTTGRIATAGLDTYEREPLPKDHPLLTLDNVVASAHAGGNTKDNDINMVNYVYHNIVAFDRGEPLNTPGDIVNGEYLKK